MEKPSTAKRLRNIIFLLESITEYEVFGPLNIVQYEEKGSWGR